MQVGEILERLDKTEENLREARSEIDARQLEVVGLNEEIQSLKNVNQKINQEVTQQKRINQQLANSSDNRKKEPEQEKPVATSFHNTDNYGVLIPGKTPQTLLQVKWNQTMESFSLSIRDERPNVIWHIDNQGDGGPAIDVKLQTAKKVWDEQRLGYSEKNRSLDVDADVCRDFLDYINGQYLEVFICATQETLRFDTDQEAVRTAISRYFAPAVTVKERLADKRANAERERVIAEEKQARERLQQALIGEWSGGFGFVSLVFKENKKATLNWYKTVFEDCDYQFDSEGKIRVSDRVEGAPNDWEFHLAGQRLEYGSGLFLIKQ